MPQLGRMNGNALKVGVVMTLLALVAGGLTMSLPASVADAAVASTSLWGSAKPKAVKLTKNSKAVELGTKFTATESGKVTGVRFYKVKGMKGKHTGSLWSGTGKKLASVKFKKESRSGWQTARFSKAVTVTSGLTYTVSLHVPKRAKYARTKASPSASASSTLMLAAGSSSGTYRTKKSVAFPKASKGNQYWVDVTFAAASANVPVSAASSSSVKGFPTRDTTGVPAGWSPTRTISGDYTVTAEGSVLEDVRITGGDLYVRAANVTVRNVEVVDGRIINFFASRCSNGMLLENVSIVRKSLETAWDPAIEAGGYTARGLKIDGWWEGLRVGGTDFNPACGPVVVEDSWINIEAPSECFTNPGSVDWHGDGLQGYGGAAVTLRNSYMQLIGNPPSCGGNATFFYPDQGNTRATVENVLLAGGGFTFRLGTPGSVSGLKIVDGSWEYGPSDVTDCSQVAWGSGNEVVRVNADGSLTSVRPLACG